MKVLCKSVFAWSITACLALSASAQDRQRPQRPGQGAGSMTALMLLRQKSVQDELKMTEDQIAKVNDASRKQAEAMQGARDLDQQERIQKMRELNQESEKLAADVLKPDQTKRFKQISLQQKKTRAFADESVVKELNLTDDQKKQLREIQDAAARERREALRQGDRGPESRQKNEELNKQTDDKVMAVLTADQKAKWKEMLGEPFKGEIRPFGGEGRPGGRGDRIP